MPDSDLEADRRLARAVATGDPEAGRQLCERFLSPLYAYVLGRSGLTVDAAADVTQETMLVALRSAQSFRGESGLYTWLCAIARRKVADHYRRESRRPLSVDDLTGRALVLLDEGPLPEELAGRDETATAIHRALWELPQDQREAVLRKYLDDRSVAEIAAEFGRSQKAVESLLSRGRASLRQRLVAWARPDEEGGTSDEGCEHGRARRRRAGRE